MDKSYLLFVPLIGLAVIIVSEQIGKRKRMIRRHKIITVLFLTICLLVTLYVFASLHTPA